MVKVYQPTGKKFSLKGYMTMYRPSLPTAPAIPAPQAIHAVTTDVDKDMFMEWLKQNHDLDMLSNGVLLWADKPADLAAKIREHEKQRCGFEPIDPRNPPKMSGHKIETYSANVN